MASRQIPQFRFNPGLKLGRRLRPNELLDPLFLARVQLVFPSVSEELPAIRSREPKLQLRISLESREIHGLVACNSETGSTPAGHKIVTVADSLGLESFTISPRLIPILLLQTTSNRLV
jgi:hypothetical protein